MLSGRRTSGRKHGRDPRSGLPGATGWSNTCAMAVSHARRACACRQDGGVDGPSAPPAVLAVWNAPAAAITGSAALLAGAVLLALSHSETAVAALLVLAVLMLLALRSGSGAAVDAMTMTILLYLAVAFDVFGLWPLPGAAAVLAAWWLARRTPRGALWRSWLRRGRVTAELPWLLVLTVLVTAAALLIWQRLLDGRLPQAYVDAAAGRPLWLLMTACAGFLLLNAAVEEAIFRGVLQTALERVSGPVVAIIVQAVAFGVLHVVGVPTGILGAVLAGGWGLLLGLMRWRTQGLLAPYVAHVAADATIFCMFLPSLR